MAPLFTAASKIAERFLGVPVEEQPISLSALITCDAGVLTSLFDEEGLRRTMGDEEEDADADEV